MLQRIWAVMQKEFIAIVRDRSTLLMIFLVPLMQLLLFGYAINMNVDHIPMVVADQSLDVASRAYVEAMISSSYFDVVEYVPDEDAAIGAIDSGRAQAGLIIPPDFGARVERGDAQALLLVDGSDMFTSQSAYDAGVVIAQDHATELLLREAARSGQVTGGGNLLPLEARIRVLYNPNMKEIWFILPGILAMLLQNQSITMTAAAIVREKEEGTIEQLLVTPIRSGELMLGKIIPNIVIVLGIMLIIIAMGIVLFHVPFRGNFWLLLWLAFMYIFSGLGLGLLISTVSQNQRQTQQLVMAVSLIGIVLGGFMFPRYSMPPVLRLVGNLFPLAYFIPIARSIMTKGVGIEFLWGQVYALGIYIIVIFFVVSNVFKQELD
ncbi:MAG: ABC transporter permease [Anaerolineae bacterium]